MNFLFIFLRRRRRRRLWFLSPFFLPLLFLQYFHILNNTKSPSSSEREYKLVKLFFLRLLAFDTTNGDIIHLAFTFQLTLMLENNTR